MSKFRLSRETWRFLRVNFPLCSDRFIENLLIIAFTRAGYDVKRIIAGDTRYAKSRPAKVVRYLLLDRYYSGDLRLKPLLKIASKALDEKNLELFLKSLFRKKKDEKTKVDVNVAMCYLDDTEKLTLHSAEDASKRVTSYLHERGVPYKLSAAAYRKRIERLPGIGVKLLCM